MTPSKRNLLHRQPENARDANKCRLWLSKWDETIAAVAGLFVFCAIVIVVIVNLTTHDQMHSRHDRRERAFGGVVVLNDASVRLHKQAPICMESNNELVCDTVDIADLCDEISNSGVTSNTVLNLLHIQFEANKIEEGWLQCTSLTIHKLTINEPSLLNIGKNAFAGVPFNQLETLILYAGVQTYKSEMFAGVALNTLELNCHSSADFDDNIFADISQSLETLHISSCINQLTGEDMLSNITGATEVLRNLKSLDLQSNQLGSIKATSFRSVPSLQTLYLMTSSITEIEADTFKGLFLETLDISNNQLKTLHENSFEDVKYGITITNNRWQCDCDLLWLKELFEHPPASNFFTHSAFQCSNKGNEIHTHVVFCNNDTTQGSNTQTSSGGTSTTTEASSTLPPEVSVVCEKPQELALFGEELTTLHLRNQTVKLFFYKRGKNYGAKVTGNVHPRDVLFAFNPQESDFRCIDNFNNNVFDISSFLQTENTSYIFCLINNTDPVSISPFDCGAITTQAQQPDTWISRDQMVPLISAIAGALFAAITLSGLIVFYCIRQHPSCIKGNKRVILVESEAADAIILPSTYYDEVSYTAPSLNSRSNGYLTPTRAVYGYPRHGSRLRTISENLAVVVPAAPSSGRAGRGRFRKRKAKLRHICEAINEQVYERPPPLPPNHPSERVYNNMSVNRA